MIDSRNNSSHDINGFNFSNYYVFCNDKTRLEQLFWLYTLAGGSDEWFQSVWSEEDIRIIKMRRELLIECAKLLGDI